MCSKSRKKNINVYGLYDYIILHIIICLCLRFQNYIINNSIVIIKKNIFYRMIYQIIKT